MSEPADLFAATGAGAPIPRGEDGAPVFAEPWEAQAFALAVALHEKGVFTWSEWAETLAGEIAAGREGSDAGSDHRHWLAAIERLVERGGLAGVNELLTRRAAFARAAAATPHGQPIVLENDPGA